MRAALIIGFFLATAAGALAPELQARMVARAQKLVGTPHEFGGRMRRGEGVDCLGVLFLTAEAIGRCSWRSFSVNPTELVARGELGRPVRGLAPVRSDALHLQRLEAGDVILLVSPVENPAEPAIATLDGKKVWVWHTGLYSGDGRWIVGDHFAGKVIETDLAAYLAEHADTYSGVFVTRMEHGPAPRRCRR